MTTTLKPPAGGGGGGASVACDYCSEQIAVVFCRADSARLCLLCDQHVHSANALSRKHVRSQICDNCAADAASVRCLSDGLSLCSACDSSSAHSFHSRRPLLHSSFSGSPSPFHVASSWGFAASSTVNIQRQQQQEEEEEQHEQVVDHGWDMAVVPTTKEAEIMKQLTELVVNEDLVPCSPDHDQEEERERELVMIPLPCDRNTNSLLWNSNSTNQPASQIWDFNLGKSRGHEESNRLDVGYGGSDDAEFMIKSYSQLLRGGGASLETRKGFEDIYKEGGVFNVTHV